jgi:hypothetical protein
VHLYTLFKAAVDRDELAAARSSCCTSKKEVPLPAESWVALRAGLDAMAKRKIPAPTGNRSSAINPVA